MRQNTHLLTVVTLSLHNSLPHRATIPPSDGAIKVSREQLQSGRKQCGPQPDDHQRPRAGPEQCQLNSYTGQEMRQWEDETKDWYILYCSEQCQLNSYTDQERMQWEDKTKWNIQLLEYITIVIMEYTTIVVYSIRSVIGYGIFGVISLDLSRCKCVCLLIMI